MVRVVPTEREVPILTAPAVLRPIPAEERLRLVPKPLVKIKSVVVSEVPVPFVKDKPGTVSEVPVPRVKARPTVVKEVPISTLPVVTPIPPLKICLAVQTLVLP